MPSTKREAKPTREASQRPRRKSTKSSAIPDEVANKISAYCALYESEDDDTYTQGAIIKIRLEDIKEALDNRGYAGGNETRDENATTTSENHSSEEDEDASALELSFFIDALGKYYELALISRTLQGIYGRSYYRGQILSYAKKHFIPIDVGQSKGDEVFGLEDYHLLEFQRRLARWDDLNDGIKSFSPSVLLGLVASYESLFADLYKRILLLRPERYDSSDRQMKVSDILKLDNFDDVLEQVAAEEVESIVSRSHVDQIESFEKNFGVSVRKTFYSWPQYVEVFERRNLAAHGELEVDEKYLNNCARAGLDITDVQLGDSLEVDHKYINQSLDLIIDLGTRLVFAAWIKQVKEQRTTAFTSMVNATYNLLKAGRFHVVERISEFVLEHYHETGDDSDLKMLQVNRAIALKKQGDRVIAEKILKEQDWTATAPLFKICVAAVLEQKEEVVRLVPVIKATEEMGIRDFRDWPAFDWIRDDPDVLHAFERAFGEPLIEANRVESFEQSH